MCSKSGWFSKSARFIKKRTKHLKRTHLSVPLGGLGKNICVCVFKYRFQEFSPQTCRQCRTMQISNTVCAFHTNQCVKQRSWNYWSALQPDTWNRRPFIVAIYDHVPPSTISWQVPVFKSQLIQFRRKNMHLYILKGHIDMIQVHGFWYKLLLYKFAVLVLPIWASRSILAWASHRHNKNRVSLLYGKISNFKVWSQTCFVRRSRCPSIPWPAVSWLAIVQKGCFLKKKTEQ